MVTVSHQLADSIDFELALPLVTIEEPAQAARSAGLRYICDDRPGFGRRRCGKGFTYFDEAGDRIADPVELKRLKALVIPPAWEQVWIIKGAAQHLGNRVATCRNFYVHPTVLEAYEKGWLLEVWRAAKSAPSELEFSPEGKALIAVLSHAQQ